MSITLRNQYKFELRLRCVAVNDKIFHLYFA